LLEHKLSPIGDRVLLQKLVLNTALEIVRIGVTLTVH
jgi:hypothetical protein